MVEAVNEVRISTPGNTGTPSWDQVSHFFPWWAEIECSCLCLPKIIVEKKVVLLLQEEPNISLVGSLKEQL